jgi:hypothetical protein
MATFNNQNILNLIFSSLTPSKIKQTLDNTDSQLLSHLLTKQMTYKNIFKSFCYKRIVMNHGSSLKNSLAIIPNKYLISVSEFDITVLDLFNYQRIESLGFNFIKSVLILPNGNILTAGSRLILFDIKKNFETTYIDIGEGGYNMYTLFLLSIEYILCTALQFGDPCFLILDTDLKCIRILRQEESDLMPFAFVNLCVIIINLVMALGTLLKFAT